MHYSHTPLKKILLTFARSPLTLDLARQLQAAGHRVLTVDSIKTPLCRYSNAVHKNFHVPSPSAGGLNAYLDALLKIVREESVDLLIPIFEEGAAISKYRELFPSSCSIFAPSFALFQQLHNKWQFQCTVKEAGLSAVHSELIVDRNTLESLNWKTPYLIKACYSRGSQSILKLQPGSPIPKLAVSPNTPYIAQKWLEGEKYCSYSVCHQGTPFAHAVYPVQYAIDGNSCVMFEAVDHPEIIEWINTFVKTTHYTGQIAFDFIQTRDKTLYAIECNPRATSGLHLFEKGDRLDQALFGLNKRLIAPKSGIKRQIAMGMLLYGWKKSSLPNNRWKTFLKDFCTIQDVVLRKDDVKPFLLKPFIFAGLYKAARKLKLPLPEFFTYDHHWNGEAMELS
jgi:predicted ATP-grasp superfamily ATP-dependent carboligase